MKVFFALIALLSALPATAETLDLGQAIERALKADPRIEEKRHFVAAARGLRQEAEGHGDWFVESNSFIGLSPATEGNIFESGSCSSGQCELRGDKYEFTGVSPWFYAKLGLIKPLYTFGKLEHYAAAAEANIHVKEGDVRLQRNATVLDVKKAYYGYLAARDGSLLLGDVSARVQKAIDLVQGWLDEGEGDVKMTDLYALQSGYAMVAKYKAQSDVLEKVALDGLKVLTGVALSDELEVADRRIRPVALPEWSLPELQQQALQQRPEMGQLESGLKARRSLLEASKSNNKPNIYAGLGALLSYSPGRESLNNPYISDPFNERALTPVIGMKWNWSPGVSRGKTSIAEAELNALIAKSSFARMGIPFQVAEQYHQVQGLYEAVRQLEQASRSARRWMIASYTDFEAGLEEAEKIMAAMQAYTLAMADYLQTTFEYNMHVARLQDVAGINQ
ncbi:MAG TPA: TolC family protein [Gammaproteobacteria bacterium]|nr:TolC family protein [Gammaproteobacteria bacterium]